MNDPVKIGISACLMGECVRYDGGHKRADFIIDIVGRWAEFVPVCPEVECGLLIPRPPMQLEGNADKPRLIEIESRIDHSDRMFAWAEKRLDDISHEKLSGFIFKANSPSCALRNAALSSPEKMSAKTCRGIWAKQFVVRFPDMPVEDEESLQNDRIRVKFVETVRGVRADH